MKKIQRKLILLSGFFLGAIGGSCFSDDIWQGYYLYNFTSYPITYVGYGSGSSIATNSVPSFGAPAVESVVNGVESPSSIFKGHYNHSSLSIGSEIFVSEPDMAVAYFLPVYVKGEVWASLYTTPKKTQNGYDFLRLYGITRPDTSATAAFGTGTGGTLCDANDIVSANSRGTNGDDSGQTYWCFFYNDANSHFNGVDVWLTPYSGNANTSNNPTMNQSYSFSVGMSNLLNTYNTYQNIEYIFGFINLDAAINHDFYALVVFQAAPTSEDNFGGDPDTAGIYDYTAVICENLSGQNNNCPIVGPTMQTQINTILATSEN